MSPAPAKCRRTHTHVHRPTCEKLASLNTIMSDVGLLAICFASDQELAVLFHTLWSFECSLSHISNLQAKPKQCVSVFYAQDCNLFVAGSAVSVW